MFHTQSEQAAEQLISEDRTTILAQVSIEKGFNTAEEVAQQLRPYMEDLPMHQKYKALLHERVKRFEYLGFESSLHPTVLAYQLVARFDDT